MRLLRNSHILKILANNYKHFSCINNIEIRILASHTSTVYQFRSIKKKMYKWICQVKLATGDYSAVSVPIILVQEMLYCVIKNTSGLCLLKKRGQILGHSQYCNKNVQNL